jgi:EAL and modified HD-GYP domain-containing signal transduction protein
MTSYIARQPIVNRNQLLVGYELFFREGPNNFYPNIDDHLATSTLIARTEKNDGILTISNGKRAFINFSERSLLNGLPKLLTPNSVIIEILETVRPTDKVYQALQHLRALGYELALDDFRYTPKWDRVIRLVSLIKFDISATPLNSLSDTIELIKKLTFRNSQIRIRFLAEKIEKQEDFTLAKSMGFDYFQGYFLFKPEMLQMKYV